jgi:cytochrome c oxidase assembly protein subunit 11
MKITASRQNSERQPEATRKLVELVQKRNATLLLTLATTAVVMLGMAYAAVPLYDTFCRVTGFGGTTNVAATASVETIDRIIVIRFDANVNGGLPWEFKPKKQEVVLKVGDNAVAYFQARNLGERAFTGTAVFNVTPQKAGQYFSKVECFCFSEQTLTPGAAADLPVAFFVDPEIASDRNLDDVTTITLSYTFYPDEPYERAEKLAGSIAVRGSAGGRLN